MTSSTDEHEASGPDNGLCRREAPHDTRVSSAKAATFEYELFVVHADADQQFVHGYLLRGDADRVTRGASEQLRWVDHEPITDDAHRDPVHGFEDCWLAGFAPVGETGFVVIVQTRYDAAIKPNARLSRRLASRTSAVILVSIVVFGASLWLYVRRRSRTRANAR